MNDKEKLAIKEWEYDLISRNGAIKALYRFCEENDTENPHIDALVDDVLGSLPEAHPTMYGWWIPVKDRLPKDGQSVLTYKNGVCDIQTYEKRRNGWTSNGWFWSMATVTHWMPLPEPPKGGSNG